MAFQDPRPQVQLGALTLEHEQPNISVDTGARYAEHKVVGDTTVRQKIGYKPDSISVDGIIEDDKLSILDGLIEEEQVQLRSNRWEGTVTVDSTSSDPIADGGGVHFNNGPKFIHNFSAECTEVTETKPTVAVKVFNSQTRGKATAVANTPGN